MFIPYVSICFHNESGRYVACGLEADSVKTLDSANDLNEHISPKDASGRGVVVLLNPSRLETGEGLQVEHVISEDLHEYIHKCMIVQHTHRREYYKAYKLFTLKRDCTTYIYMFFSVQHSYL